MFIGNLPMVSEILVDRKNLIDTARQLNRLEFVTFY